MMTPSLTTHALQELLQGVTAALQWSCVQVAPENQVDLVETEGPWHDAA